MVVYQQMWHKPSLLEVEDPMEISYITEEEDNREILETKVAGEEVETFKVFKTFSKIKNFQTRKDSNN